MKSRAVIRGEEEMANSTIENERDRGVTVGGRGRK